MSDDPELIEAAKLTIARAHGIPESRAHRLVGASASELHADAKAMARELNVLDPSERQRDEGGRFAEGDGATINQLIRHAAARA